MPVLKNAKQEKFAQNLIKGMSQRQAYLDAFPNSQKWKPNTVDTKASELANTVEVLGRCEELQAASACDAILDRQGRMIILTDFAMDDGLHPKTRMQAIDLLNKMDGDYVKRVEATLTAPISDTAAKVAAILDED